MLLCAFSSLHRNVHTSLLDSSCCFLTTSWPSNLQRLCLEHYKCVCPPINMNTAVCAAHLIIAWAENGCNEVLWILKLLHSHHIAFLSESALCWYNWSLAARPHPPLLVWKRGELVFWSIFSACFWNLHYKAEMGLYNLLKLHTHTHSSLLLNVSVDCLSQTR